MKLINIFLFLLLIFSTASADVQTSNTYYAGGSSVEEGVSLKNMDYTNTVQISPGQVASVSSGVPSGDAGTAKFGDSISINHGSCGAALSVDAKDLSYSRLLEAGNANVAKFSASFGSGLSHSRYFDSTTSVIEKVRSKNNLYQTIFGATLGGTFSNSVGVAVRDVPSSLSYDITLDHAGKSSKIEAKLVTGQAVSGRPPINCFMNVFEGSNQEFAEVGTKLKAENGNRPVDLSIIGTSEALSDKHSGPSHLAVMTWNKVSQALYMTYQIS